MKNFLFLSVLLLFSCEIDNSVTPKTTFPGNSKAGRAHNKHYPQVTPKTILTISFGENNLNLVKDDLISTIQERDQVNNLYFLTFAVPNSSLFEDWNITAPLYEQGRMKIDSTLTKIPTPDIIRFIWVHGETDAQVLEWSQEYGENQAWMINFLDVEYGFNQIIDYNLQGIDPNIQLIRAGKEQNAGAIDEITLIDVPLENFAQAVANLY